MDESEEVLPQHRQEPGGRRKGTPDEKGADHALWSAIRPSSSVKKSKKGKEDRRSWTGTRAIKRPERRKTRQSKETLARINRSDQIYRPPKKKRQAKTAKWSEFILP